MASTVQDNRISSINAQKFRLNETAAYVMLGLCMYRRNSAVPTIEEMTALIGDEAAKDENVFYWKMDRLQLAPVVHSYVKETLPSMKGEQNGQPVYYSGMFPLDSETSRALQAVAADVPEIGIVGVAENLFQDFHPDFMRDRRDQGKEFFENLVHYVDEKRNPGTQKAKKNFLQNVRDTVRDTVRGLIPFARKKSNSDTLNMR